jgi:AcrR family transcriptional regulator
VPPRRRRLTRAEQQAETRTRVLDAAVRVFRKRGLYDATLEEISEAAGYTRGAVYSNFAGKEDLLLAVLEHRLEPRFQALAAPLIEARSAADQGEAMRMFMRGLLTEERSHLLLLCEFWGHAVREPRVRERFVQTRRARRALIEAMIERRLARHETPLRRSPSELAAGFLALAVGVLFEGIVDPELDPEALHSSIFTLIAEAAVEPKQGSR